MASRLRSGMADSYPNVTDALSELRLLLLRSIATIWRADKDISRQGMNINMNNICPKKLQKEWKLKWKYVNRKDIEKLDPKSIQWLWKDKLAADFQYPNFGIQLIKPTATWNIYRDNKWSKPDTESIYISLPINLPGNGDKAVKNRKLTFITDYYQYFPSFLGQIKRRTSTDKMLIIEPKDNFLTLKKTENYPPLDESLYLEKIDIRKKQFDLGGNDYDLGIAQGDYLSLNAMLLKLIPVLWGSDILRKRLDYAQRLYNTTDLLDSFNIEGVDACHSSDELKIPSIYALSYYLNQLEDEEDIKQLKEFDRAYQEELAAILKEHFNYKNPWIFDLKFLIPDWEVFFNRNGRLRPIKHYLVNEKDRTERITEIDTDEIEIIQHKTTIKSTSVHEEIAGCSIDDNGMVTGKNVSGEDMTNTKLRVVDSGHTLVLTTIEVPNVAESADMNDITLALARYNAIGPAYPFTCS